MMSAPPPPNEAERQRALELYEVLDTLPEQVFDDITFLAAQICDAPISLFSLIDKERQWFKSAVGLPLGETHRELAFCAHAINKPNEIFIVPETLIDERFADHPSVKGGPYIRSYAGAPLVTPDGLAIGTLCVIDRKPRQLTAKQLSALEALSRQVVMHLEMRKAVFDLERLVGARSFGAAPDAEVRINAVLERLHHLKGALRRN